jgi:hypothetical protein
MATAMSHKFTLCSGFDLLLGSVMINAHPWRQCTCTVVEGLVAATLPCLSAVRLYNEAHQTPQFESKFKFGPTSGLCSIIEH